MIDFMIVDDEYLERILISKSFSWEENGFCQVAEASNGEDGLKSFLKHQPSLVLTDINMPYMDGLQLATEIKKINPETEVIIITGFCEFEYALKAVNIGVDSFLLKPINRDELCNAALKAKKKIVDRLNKKNVVLQMQLQLEESLPIVTESFLQRLVCGRVSELEFYERLLNDSALSALKGDIVCVYFRKESDRMQDDIISFAKDWNFICFDYYQGGKVMLISIANGMQEADQKIVNKLSSFYFNSFYCIGVSEVTNGINGIMKAFSQAKETSGVLELIQKKGVASYQKLIKSLQHYEDKEISSLLNDYTMSLKSCQWDLAKDLALQCLFHMVRTNETDIGMVRLAILRILTISSIVLEDKESDLFEKCDGEVLITAGKVECIHEAKEELIRMIELYQKRYLSKNTVQRSKLINKIVDYIDNHFCDAELSLKTIAKEFYINDSYLSRVFKNEMEKGIVEYITECRINKAVDLLKDPSLKCYQVAEMVGINDSHYFGQCFKRQLGITVNEFRKNLKK